MEIKIRRISNGYMIENKDDDILEEIYAENTRDLFLELQSLLGANGSRHDEKRVYIIEAPGDKHDNWTDAHSAVIFGVEDGEF